MVDGQGGYFQPLTKAAMDILSHWWTLVSFHDEEWDGWVVGCVDIWVCLQGAVFQRIGTILHSQQQWMRTPGAPPPGVTWCGQAFTTFPFIQNVRHSLLVLPLITEYGINNSPEKTAQALNRRGFICGRITSFPGLITVSNAMAAERIISEAFLTPITDLEGGRQASLLMSGLWHQRPGFSPGSATY